MGDQFLFRVETNKEKQKNAYTQDPLQQAKQSADYTVRQSQSNRFHDLLQ